MKKVLSVILIIITLLTLSACGGKTPKPAYDAPSDGVLGTENMDSMLRTFLNVSDDHPNGDMGERRPFSESEKKMSERLVEIMREITEGDESFSVDSVPFTVSGYGESQNVIARKSGTGEAPRKTVVIGANYDAFISQTFSLTGNNNQTVSESVGAMENGTGCAVVLALMQYALGKTFEFDIDFVLFGDGSYGNSGAYRYVNDMSVSRRENILLMFSLKRFGGDNVYLYGEEVKTAHENYLLNISGNLGLGISETPKQMPVINAQAFPRLPYAKWIMAGVHAPFMEEHIPVAAVFSGNYETLNLGDVESAAVPTVSYTTSDVYTRLKRNLPSYAVQMSAAANLVAGALDDASFAKVMSESKSSYRNYDWATNSLAIRLTVIGLLIALGIAVVVVAKKFEKKYPYTPPKIKIKVAVFGPDYEDKDADILIDVKKPDDPFGGKY